MADDMSVFNINHKYLFLIFMSLFFSCGKNENLDTLLINEICTEKRTGAGYYLKNIVEPDKVLNNGETPLTQSIKCHNYNEVKVLVMDYWHKVDIDKKNKSGYSPINLAIKECDLKSVVFLKWKGAKINKKDNKFNEVVSYLNGNNDCKNKDEILKELNTSLPEWKKKRLKMK